MSGSRFALAACLATATRLGIIALVARSRRRVVSILVLLAIAGALVGAAWKWYPSGRNARTDIAFSIRFEMANAGLQMTAERPWFGVGLGWFQPRSVLYSSMRENSHNNYIQVMAELGILGLSRSWPRSRSRFAKPGGARPDRAALGPAWRDRDAAHDQRRRTSH